MEKCKYCQADLADNGTFCPSCGRDNAAETMEENIGTEQMPVVEEPAADTPAAAKETKKATPGKIALAVAAVVVLVAALIALVTVGMKGGNAEMPAETVVAATVPADGNPNDATCKGTYTVSDEEIVAAADTVVATLGEYQLTNSQLQVYYWMEVQGFLVNYGNYAYYFGLDATQPLDVQMSPDGMTWQQYFLQSALNNWHQTQAMAAEAKNAGLEIAQEDREYLDGLPASLEETAAANGMTLDELMRRSIGAGADMDDYIHFQQLYCQGLPYYNAEVEKMVPTEEELNAYYDLHAAEYTSNGIIRDGDGVDVRHILVSVTEEDWEGCEAKAQAILDEWLAGDKTEDSFAALANEKSEDPGSNDKGGLYEGVWEGQMVPEFNDWCFDESREYGDYGLVKTSYGYHIMFFVGREPIDWKTPVTNYWVNEQAANLLTEVEGKYTMDVTYENISLGYVNISA